MTPRRQYAVALTCVVLGAVLVLISAGQTWATGEVAGSSAAGHLKVTGHDAAGGVAGVALVALAGIAGLVATRGRLRRVVAVVVILAGLSVVAQAVASDLHGALDKAAATAAGVSSAHATRVQTTLAGWVCVLGGLLIIAGGWLAVRHGKDWPAMGSRYERSGARTDRPLDTWAALDQGIDPTADVDAAEADPADPGRMQP